MTSDKRYVCQDCGRECWGDDAVRKDEGGFVEFWGSKAWMPSFVSVCPNCGGENLQEIDEDNDDKNTIKCQAKKRERKSNNDKRVRF